MLCVSLAVPPARGNEVPDRVTGPDGADAADAAGAAPRRAHDYKRHGTSTLFAALEIATGRVTEPARRDTAIRSSSPSSAAPASAYPHDRTGQELHMVMDNYAAPKRMEVHDWLGTAARVGDI